MLEVKCWLCLEHFDRGQTCAQPPHEHLWNEELCGMKDDAFAATQTSRVKGIAKQSLERFVIAEGSCSIEREQLLGDSARFTLCEADAECLPLCMRIREP